MAPLEYSCGHEREYLLTWNDVRLFSFFFFFWRHQPFCLRSSCPLMRKNKFGNKPSGGGEKPNAGWGKGGDGGGGFKKKKFKATVKPVDPDAPPGEQKEDADRDMETVEDGIPDFVNFHDQVSCSSINFRCLQAWCSIWIFAPYWRASCGVAG